MAEARQISTYSAVIGNTAQPFSTQINVAGGNKTTNEKIKEAIGARLGSSPRKKNVHLGTCEWLGTIQNFRDWITDKSRSRGLLWFCGGPGKGKSHISTYLVARLENGSINTEVGDALSTSELGDNRLVLSYFCDDGDVLHSTELAVVLGLLNQLLESNDSEELYSVISPKFSGRGQNLFSSPFIQDLWDCLEQMIRVASRSHQVYLVLDGLDECDSSSRSKLSEQMRKICNDHRQNENSAVKVVIFSRPLDLSHQADLAVDLHAPESLEQTKKDIRMIVEGSCRLIQDKEIFCDILTERANGTFLWVALALSLLKDISVQQKVVCENPAFLDELLPIGLDAMYNRMLFNIIEHLHRNSHRHDMMRVFRCITFSQRPLTIEEVRVLTDCDSPFVADVISVFSHVLSMTGGSDGGTIELVHMSLREYLTKRSANTIPEEICWFLWPFSSSMLDLLRVNRFQLWFLDYAVFATVCFHFQGFLRQQSTIGFGIFSLTLCHVAFQRFRSSLLIDLTGRALGRLMVISLMVMFHVKKEDTHLYLFERCIAVMSDEKDGLKRDIQEAESPHLQKQLEVKERWRRVQYPSRHWVAHLKESGAKSSAMDKVYIFLQQHFLHWLEALAHLGVVSGAARDLDTIERIAPDESRTDLLKFLYDAGRFLRKNRYMAEVAPLQLYYAGLIFSPSKSIIRKQFEKEIRLIRPFPRVEESWSSNIQNLEGHSDRVWSVAFSPDGRMLASGSDDKTVRLWDLVSGAQKQTLEGHSNSVSSVAFSPDGRILASGSNDKTVRLWDPVSGALKQMLKGHTRSVYSVAFSPDGRLLASGSEDKTVRLWDPFSGTLKKTLKGHTRSVYSVAFSPDGQLLASGSRDKTIQLWDPALGTLKQTLEGHSSLVKSVTFSPDGQLLASSSKDKTVRLWDLVSGAQKQTLEGHSNSVYSVAFSPDGRLLASASEDKTIQLWDPVSAALKNTLKGHSRSVYSVAFSPDGRLLASGSEDKTVQLWDPALDMPKQALEDNLASVHSITFSPNGLLLASGSNDQDVRLWDPVSGTLKQPLKGHSAFVQSVAFSPDGRLLASGSEDKTVRLWDPVSGTLKKTLKGHTRSVYSVAFSPDGRLLASGSEDKTVRLWDPFSGTLKKTLKGHTRSVYSVAFSSDGQLLASGSRDKTIQLWDPAFGTPKEKLEGHSNSVSSVAFSPKSQLLASGSKDETVRLWDPVLGALKQTFDTRVAIFRIEFSSDGSFVKINSSDRRIECKAHAPSIKTSIGPKISIHDHWVELNGRKVLWLPNEYRPTCSAASGSLLALGHSSGRVTFIGFHL